VIGLMIVHQTSVRKHHLMKGILCFTHFVSHVDSLKVVSVNTNHETCLDQKFFRVFTVNAYFSSCKISVSILFY